LNTPVNPAGAVADSRTVAEVGEHELIAFIRSRTGPPPAWMPVGIGDDAAVVEPVRGSLTVLKTDGLVEGIHFDRRFCTAFDVGWKALAVNLSDVAAMGAAPRAALLSISLPAALPFADFAGLLDGFLALARDARVALAGGNLTRSPGPLVVDVSVTGFVRRRDVLRRSGARAGDVVFVSGAVGSARAGLESLSAAADDGRALAGNLEGAAARYRRPAPRSRLGALLGRARAATACMDLSDGLADAVTQVATASGRGARIHTDALPIDPAVRRWFEARGGDPVTAACAGGDDYELLFTVPRRRLGRLRHVIREARGVAVTRIGEITADRDIVLVRDGRPEPLPAGFVHF
jgi:thiamine-monophosphate kinase